MAGAMIPLRSNAAVLLLLAAVLHNCSSNVTLSDEQLQPSSTASEAKPDGCTGSMSLIQAEKQVSRSSAPEREDEEGSDSVAHDSAATHGKHGAAYQTVAGHTTAVAFAAPAGQAEKQEQIAEQAASNGRKLFQKDVTFSAGVSGVVEDTIAEPASLLAYAASTAISSGSSSSNSLAGMVFLGILIGSLMISCSITHAFAPDAEPEAQKQALSPALPSVAAPGLKSAPRPKSVRFHEDSEPPQETEDVHARPASNPESGISYRRTLLGRALRARTPLASSGQPSLGRSSTAPLLRTQSSETACGKASRTPVGMPGQPLLGRASTMPFVEDRSSARNAFCPGLVVPEGCECVLLVPVGSLRAGALDICDPNGHVLLRMLPRSGAGFSQPLIPRDIGLSPRQPAMTVNWHLELTASAGDLLAQSCITTSKSSISEHTVKTEFDLFRADGSYYATLQPNYNGSYELVTPNSRIHFWGSFDFHAVNIADSTGRLLGTTELCVADFDPSGDYFCLRVAPQVDAGLILSSLICIQQANFSYCAASGTCAANARNHKRRARA